MNPQTGSRRNTKPLTDFSACSLLTVLPPRERFAPHAAGAISLLVQRLATPREIVVGAPVSGMPFLSPRFMPVHDNGLLKTRWPAGALWPPGGIRTGALRYAAGVAELIAGLRPPIVEIHNRPEIARALRQWFPHLPMRLVLHNDPQGMRRARSPAEREWLSRRMGIVCVSDWVRRRWCEGTPLHQADLYLLPNCLDLSTLPAAQPATRREQIILFAGRIVADKGADAFVAACEEALPHLPGWRAEMIGADRFGPDSPDTPFLRDLRPRAQKAGVLMLGYQPHDAVLRAMSRAAITVVPGRWEEPFGLTALEAMACGSPLIASPRGALPDLARHVAAFADPDTPGELALTLLEIAGSPSRRARMAAAGLERAAQFDVTAARALRARAPAF